ncbi:hypothetical protein AKG94_21320 [Vibrio harveyi]|nr:hypothetical protein AKG94_21320 [Vibrio harveyi]
MLIEVDKLDGKFVEVDVFRFPIRVFDVIGLTFCIYWFYIFVFIRFISALYRWANCFIDNAKFIFFPVFGRSLHFEI